MPKFLRCPFCSFTKSWVVRRRHRKCKYCRREWSPLKESCLGSFRFSSERWKRILSIFLREKTGQAIIRAGLVSSTTAYKMILMIRTFMRGDIPQLLAGTCEVDESYFGGLWRNLHRKKRAALKGTRGRKTTKQGFFGAVSREGKQAIIFPIANAQCTTLVRCVKQTVEKGSVVYSDGHYAYRHLKKHGYKHAFVEHRQGEYVRGDVHTQTIDGLWGTIKARLKPIGGISKKQLPLFVAEQLWRYNFRHLTHDEQVKRLLDFITRIGGRS